MLKCIPGVMLHSVMCWNGAVQARDDVITVKAGGEVNRKFEFFAALSNLQ
jgi:hypothetical protein